MVVEVQVVAPRSAREAELEEMLGEVHQRALLAECECANLRQRVAELEASLRGWKAAYYAARALLGFAAVTRGRQ